MPRAATLDGGALRGGLGVARLLRRLRGYYAAHSCILTLSHVVYFDPFVERRLDGLGQLRAHYEPLRGKIFADRFELLAPRVQALGDAAVLTFNFVSYAGETAQRWNCTEVFRRSGGTWRIIQTHWSWTTPPTALPAVPPTAPSL